MQRGFYDQAELDTAARAVLGVRHVHLETAVAATVAMPPLRSSSPSATRIVHGLDSEG
jgi:hypothetical protein